MTDTNIKYHWVFEVTEKENELGAIDILKIDLLIQREIYASMLAAVENKLVELHTRK